MLCWNSPTDYIPPPYILDLKTTGYIILLLLYMKQRTRDESRLMPSLPSFAEAETSRGSEYVEVKQSASGMHNRWSIRKLVLRVLLINAM